MPNQQFFLSHSSADKTFANLLIAKLKEAGVQDTWFDAFELTTLTDNIRASIEAGIKAADIFGILLSPAANESQWVSYEIQTALQENKRVAALLHNAPNGETQFLHNPHINKLLQGGNHLVINLTIRPGEIAIPEEGFIQLLRAVAPEIGIQRETSFTLQSILESEDPDVAQRAMSVAAVEPDRYLPGLLKRLPEMRNTQLLRYRVSRGMCYLGSLAIEPLISVLMSKEKIASTAFIPNRAADDYDKDTKAAQYIGSDVVSDFMRHTIMFGGNRQWSAQLGAEWCLTALAQDSANARVRILEELRTILKTYMDVVSRIRDGDQTLNDDGYDVLRLSIETFGYSNALDKFDPWLVYQFLTESLWGEAEMEAATDKLSSYVVSCLSRLKNNSALTYLIELSKDKHQARIYFDGNTSPNPWETCFIPFGNSAVDALLERMGQAAMGLKMLILLNLAQIPNARAHKSVAEFLLQSTNDAPASDLCYLALALSKNATAKVCSQLLHAFLNQQLPMSLKTSHNWQEVLTAVAIAAGKADDQTVARDACKSLLTSKSRFVLYHLIQSIADGGFHEFYPFLFEWFESSPDVYVRTIAAVSLSKNKILKDPQRLLEQMKAAADQFEIPQLALALSYFADPRAIPGLIAGLRQSFEEQNLAAHEVYASALQNMPGSEAIAARAKWYRRM